MPFLTANFIASVVALAAIYAVLTLALNLQFGAAGLINFGIVAYFAVGAYTYAIVTQPPPGLLDQYALGLEWPAWAGLLLAVIAAIAFALLTGWPSLRLRAEYLALTTFAFAEVFNAVLLNEQAIGNGERGLSSIYPPMDDLIPGENYEVYFAGGMLVILAVSLFALIRLSRSPFGYTLRMIRDDELAAQMVGKHVRRFRLQAFLGGAAIAALGGVFYSWFTTLVAPGLFTADVTFTAFIALVLGGVGSYVGAVVGAFVLFSTEEMLRFLPLSLAASQLATAIRLIILGLILILVLRFLPQGLVARWAP
jgi:branched-chain amino acid transport system permease protein